MFGGIMIQALPSTTLSMELPVTAVRWGVGRSEAAGGSVGLLAVQVTQ